METIKWADSGEPIDRKRREIFRAMGAVRCPVWRHLHCHLLPRHGHRVPTKPPQPTAIADLWAHGSKAPNISASRSKT